MRVPVRVRDHLDVPDAQIRRLEDADGGKRKFGSFIATILKLHYWQKCIGYFLSKKIAVQFFDLNYLNFKYNTDNAIFIKTHFYIIE